MMSSPHSTCLRTTPATASRTAACNSAPCLPGFFSSAISCSTTFAVRGRLPVWVVRIRWTIVFLRSEAAYCLDDMLDVRRRREAVPDKLAPFLEVGGFPEILGVILQRLPLHEEPIALRHFMRTLQGHGLATLGTLEDGTGFLHAGFELGFHAGFHVDLRNFKDHVTCPCDSKGRDNIMKCLVARGKAG